MNIKEMRRVAKLERSIEMLESKLKSLQKENEDLKQIIKTQLINREKQDELIKVLAKRIDELNSFNEKQRFFNKKIGNVERDVTLLTKRIQENDSKNKIDEKPVSVNPSTFDSLGRQYDNGADINRMLDSLKGGNSIGGSRLG